MSQLLTAAQIKRLKSIGARMDALESRMESLFVQAQGVFGNGAETDFRHFLQDELQECDYVYEKAVVKMAESIVLSWRQDEALDTINEIMNAAGLTMEQVSELRKNIKKS